MPSKKRNQSQKKIQHAKSKDSEVHTQPPIEHQSNSGKSEGLLDNLIKKIFPCCKKSDHSYTTLMVNPDPKFTETELHREKPELAAGSPPPIQEVQIVNQEIQLSQEETVIYEEIGGCSTKQETRVEIAVDAPLQFDSEIRKENIVGDTLDQVVDMDTQEAIIVENTK